MNSLANEMTARAIVTDRLHRAAAAYTVALVKTAAHRSPARTRWAMTRQALGGRVISMGRRLAGSPEPATVDRGC